MKLRSFFKFLVKERAGKHRPTAARPEDVMRPEDYQLREEFSERLRRALEKIDITAELWSLHKKER
jgi:hypothetical protein